jgi:hypothetical protein
MLNSLHPQTLSLWFLCQIAHSTCLVPVVIEAYCTMHLAPFHILLFLPFNLLSFLHLLPFLPPGIATPSISYRFNLAFPSPPQSSFSYIQLFLPLNALYFLPLLTATLAAQPPLKCKHSCAVSCCLFFPTLPFLPSNLLLFLPYPYSSP